jgi:hypothetical protein
MLLINTSIEIPDSRGSSDPDLEVAGYSIEGKADDEWQVLQLHEADEALYIKLMKRSGTNHCFTNTNTFWACSLAVCLFF